MRSTARNAVVHPVVDYVGDPLGARTALAFAGWDARARAGLLSQAVLGQDDASRTYTGQGPVKVQNFTGAAALIGNPLQYRDGVNTMDSQVSDEALSDPARRIFAERLRRRQ